MNLYDDILCKYKVIYNRKYCYVNAYCSSEAFLKAQDILNIPESDRTFTYVIYIEDVERKT